MNSTLLACLEHLLWLHGLLHGLLYASAVSPAVSLAARCKEPLGASVV